MNIAERRQRVRELAESGLPQDRIAARMHIGIATVRRDLRAAGYRPRYWVTDEHLAVARRLLDQGMTYPEASRATGISTMTLHRRLPGYRIAQADAARKAGIASGVARRQRATLRWLHEHRHIITQAPEVAP